MEGLPTKISKKKASRREKSHWVLSMSLTESSNLLPKVTLCGEEGSAEMEILNTTPTDWIISYSVNRIKRLLIFFNSAERCGDWPVEKGQS